MNRQQMLAQIDQEIETNLPSLGFWQALRLGLIVLGLVGQGWSQLSKIAEEIPEEDSYNTVRQRVKRWVRNPRLDLRGVRRIVFSASSPTP
jgi:hypothetical protein